MPIHCQIRRGKRAGGGRPAKPVRCDPGPAQRGSRECPGLGPRLPRGQAACAASRARARAAFGLGLLCSLQMSLVLGGQWRSPGLSPRPPMPSPDPSEIARPSRPRHERLHGRPCHFGGSFLAGAQPTPPPGCSRCRCSRRVLVRPSHRCSTALGVSLNRSRPACRRAGRHSRSDTHYRVHSYWPAVGRSGDSSKAAPQPECEVHTCPVPAHAVRLPWTRAVPRLRRSTAGS